MAKLIDWLKFFPYIKWQEEFPKTTEIRGPYFRKPRPNRWFFGDTSFHFDAPWSNPVFGFGGRGRTVDSLKPGRSNILTADLERVFGAFSDAPSGQWEYKLFYKNTWYFLSPWFSRVEAYLDAGGLLVSAGDYSPFRDANFFHPRVFESVVAGYLDTSFGYRRSGKKPNYRGPLNWRVLPLSSSIQAIVCDIHEIHNGGRDNPGIRRFIFFPVTKQHFARILFNFGGVEMYRDEVRSKPLLSLANSIINSMRLEVGSSTQAEWDKVKETCPDMSITETFGELPWPLFKEKKRKKPKETDITPNDIPKVLSNK